MACRVFLSRTRPVRLPRSWAAAGTASNASSNAPRIARRRGEGIACRVGCAWEGPVLPVNVRRQGELGSPKLRSHPHRVKGFLSVLEGHGLEPGGAAVVFVRELLHEDAVHLERDLAQHAGLVGVGNEGALEAVDDDLLDLVGAEM